MLSESAESVMTAETDMENNAKTGWPDRFAEVKDLQAYLEDHYGDPPTLKRLIEFIDDEKWNIRNAVAETILNIPADDLFPFLKLTGDENSFVATTAKQMLKRRNMYAEGAKKREKQTSSLFRNEDIILKKFGPEALELARRDAAFAYEITVASVAHDIRGILTPMKTKMARLENIIDGKLPVAEMQDARRCISVLTERTEMLEHMTEDIHTLVRKTPAGRTQECVFDLLRKACDLEVENLLAKERNIGGIKVSMKVSPDLRFRVSRDLMIRVFRNLIKNAYESFLIAEATYADRGNIDISAEQVSDGIEIRIKDNGMGMPADELKIAQQFRPRSTSKKLTGTGFGLAIAYAKIIDHKGTMTLKSKENVGTVATVFLPVKGDK